METIINAIVYLIAMAVFLMIELAKGLFSLAKSLYTTISQRRAAARGPTAGPASGPAAAATERAPGAQPGTSRRDEPQMHGQSGASAPPQSGLLLSEASAAQSADEDAPAPARKMAAKRPRPKRPRRAAAYEERFAGELVEFGVGEFRDASSNRSYSSYFVSIETDDGAIVTKRGVELEKAIEYAGAKAGDSVELLFLGKEPVEVQSGEKKITRQRNRWRINKL